jgi:hypothetical protein
VFETASITNERTNQPTTKIPAAESEFENEGENTSRHIDSPKVCGSVSIIKP